MADQAHDPELKRTHADAELSDVVIIARYQRLSPDGLAGFGTAAAYAKALGKIDDRAKLKAIVKYSYQGDRFASKLAEKAR